MTDEQFKKLPEYARREIERLRGEVEYAKRQLAELDDPNTTVKWEVGGTEHGLPARANIIFRLPEGKLELCLREDVIKVYGEGRNSGMLYSRPKAENCIIVGLVECSK